MSRSSPSDSSRTDSGSSPASSGAHEELEELSDGAILAQEARAHAPQARQQVRIESASIVVSDVPAPDRLTSTLSPSSARQAEATLVIRDRRKVDAIRRAALARSTTHKKGEQRMMFLFGGAAAAAFITGAAIAYVASDRAARRSNAANASSAAVGMARPQPTSSAKPEHPSESDVTPVSIEELPVRDIAGQRPGRVPANMGQSGVSPKSSGLPKASALSKAGGTAPKVILLDDEESASAPQ